jgi:diadenosine tetraphosphate (Ap4A) HIT family hydrolase
VSFTVDPKLAADTILVGDLVLSRVLLMNDARYDWLILVPRRTGVKELIDLTRDERTTLMDEIALASEAVRGPDVTKINVGALGNIVRQLHVHVVARREGDFAWPGPVWGAGVAEVYEDGVARAKVEQFKRALGM